MIIIGKKKKETSGPIGLIPSIRRGDEVNHPVWVTPRLHVALEPPRRKKKKRSILVVTNDKFSLL